MRLLRTLAALIALALPAQAQEISLNQISNYLNALKTAQTAFTQHNADGSISRGTLYIKRPGRARFEYAAPDESLVMAGAGQVAIFDSRSNEKPEHYPLKRTPLNLILAQRVDLGRARMVVGHRAEGDTTRVVAQDPDKPDYGTIELVFTDSPVRLRSWIITDDTGGQTTVDLGDLQSGMALPDILFDIAHEEARRGD